MRMTEAPRSSSDLRRELQALDVDLEQLGGKLSTCDVRIRGLALLARRGDAASVKQIAEAKSLKVAIGVEIDFTAAARVALSAEINAALEREAAEARKVAAAAAEKFAADVGPLGAVLDETLRRFKAAYLDLKLRLHEAERSGHGPAAAVVQASLVQATRAMLWDIAELEIKPWEGARKRSFAELTALWAGAAMGAAMRLLAPPAASSPRVNGANGSSRPLPGPTDVGERFHDDDPAFTIKEIPKEGRL
jgi:hypothetical protein